MLAYLYLSPALAFILVIFVYPVFDLIWRSLTQVTEGVITLGRPDSRTGPPSRDPVFWQALSNNLRLFLAVPILVVLSLISPRSFSIEIRGWRLYRTIVFIPYVLAIPVVALSSVMSCSCTACSTSC